MSRLAVLATSALVMVTCLLGGCASTGAEPLPFVAFSDFEVGQFGGVGGRQNVLRVRTDGVAILMSPQPASGRFAASTVDRLRTLLESEELRREAAAAAAKDAEQRVPKCADLFSTAVTMGDLHLSVAEPCGSDAGPPTPAFDEIVTLTAAALRGEFDGPVDSREPKLRALELERAAYGDHVAFTITVDPDGRSTLSYAGHVRRRLTLDAADRDTLRLLVARLVEVPTQPCTMKSYSRLTITGVPASSGRDCSFDSRFREYGAVAHLLQRALSVEI